MTLQIPDTIITYEETDNTTKPEKRKVLLAQLDQIKSQVTRLRPRLLNIRDRLQSIREKQNSLRGTPSDSTARQKLQFRLQKELSRKLQIQFKLYHLQLRLIKVHQSVLRLHVKETGRTPRQWDDLISMQQQLLQIQLNQLSQQQLLLQLETT